MLSVTPLIRSTRNLYTHSSSRPVVEASKGPFNSPSHFWTAPPPPTPSQASSLTPTVLSTMHLIMSTIDYIPTPAGLTPTMQILMSTIDYIPTPAGLTPTMQILMSTIDYIPTPAGLTPTMQILMSTIDYIPTPACLTPTMHLLMSTTDDIPTPPACLQLWGLQGSF